MINEMVESRAVSIKREHCYSTQIIQFNSNIIWLIIILSHNLNMTLESTANNNCLGAKN